MFVSFSSNFHLHFSFLLRLFYYSSSSLRLHIFVLISSFHILFPLSCDFFLFRIIYWSITDTFFPTEYYNYYNNITISLLMKKCSIVERSSIKILIKCLYPNLQLFCIVLVYSLFPSHLSSTVLLTIYFLASLEVAFPLKIYVLIFLSLSFLIFISSSYLLVDFLFFNNNFFLFLCLLLPVSFKFLLSFMS